MTTASGGRPGGIVLLAWVAIAFAALSLVSALLGGVLHFFTFSAEEPGALLAEASSDLPPAFGWMLLPFRFFLPLVALQAIVAIVVIVGGIFLLRLREPGRVILESAAWLFLVLLVLTSVGFGLLWLATSSQIPIDAEFPFPPAVFGVFGLVTLAFNLVLFGGPLGFAIWYLRSDEVRRSMR